VVALLNFEKGRLLLDGGGYWTVVLAHSYTILGNPSDRYDPTYLHKSLTVYSRLRDLYCFSATSLCSFDNPFVYAVSHLLLRSANRRIVFKEAESVASLIVCSSSRGRLDGSPFE